MTIDYSAGARIAEPDEAISYDELHLAGRNHSMPLEALRYDVTPIGLHYLLTHYDIPAVDPNIWQLVIDGHVTHPLAVGLADLMALPRVSHTVTFECAGNGRARLNPRPVSQPWLDGGVGTATWTGTPLTPLLESAGVLPGAVDVVFTGADHGVERGVEQDYARGLALAECLRPEVFLAYEVNGLPLPPQHGYPLRLVVPGWYGMTQVKWLRSIRVLDHAFAGYQNAVAYRIRVDADDPGEPVTRIQPRALMIPPGFPDFMSRTRVVDAGVHLLEGRAWSGFAPISRVEVSVDGGASWNDASLTPPSERWAWTYWSFPWSASVAGRYSLQVRAWDAVGNVQPVSAAWNRGGMANNLVQHVDVVVRQD